MKLSELFGGLFCGLAVMTRMTELGAAPVVSICAGAAAGTMIAVGFSAADRAVENEQHRAEQRRRAAQSPKHSTQPEKLPPGIVRVDGQLRYACTLRRPGSYKSYFDRYNKNTAEAEELPHKPIRKIGGSLAEDFSRLSEEERRAFFEDWRI